MKTFDINFRGYDKEQVDNYLQDLESRYDSTMRAQKERIFSLVEEVSTLTEQLRQYKIDEQAISKSLVESQKLATELRYDADKYSQLTLSRAKVFYAAWQTYAKTLLATLTDGEVRQFNALSDKISTLIGAYEGNASAGDNSQFVAASVIADDITNDTVPADNVVSVTSNAVPSTVSSQDANPINRVTGMAQQTIDPRELLRSDVSLEQLCKDLGLIE